MSEVWGKTVCETWGAAQRGCVWRAGASGDECKPNTVLSCNDQYDEDCINGGSGVSDYWIKCNADSSCRGAELIEGTTSIDCMGFKSCTDSELRAGANVDCAAEESCTGASMSAGGTVTCGGLHSCSSMASLSTGKLSCLGEESCASNDNEVHASVLEECKGSTLLGASVSCAGKQACAEAVFGLDDFESGAVQSAVISGFKGAMDATLYNVGVMLASRASSLMGATVRANTGSSTVILTGRTSGKNACISCEGDA